MEVILLEKVRNLGELGQEVRVKSGYARNYLIPFGKAVIASKESREAFETRRAEFEKAQSESMADASRRSEKISGARIEISSRASEEGKLFGSVAARDIAEAMKEQGYETNRSEIQMPGGPIKEVGEYEFVVALHPEVSVNATVTVVAEA